MIFQFGEAEPKRCGGSEKKKNTNEKKKQDKDEARKRSKSDYVEAYHLHSKCSDIK